MPKLFLVGITPDHRGLVLSEHARAKRGDMVLAIDDRLLEAIDKAQRLRTQDDGERLESNALPTKRGVNGESDEVNRLTPREIQQRLRAGESIAALARSSGTDEAWIRRFAAPVLAEQARVIERARGLTYAKRGVGMSGVPLGPAVAANVIDRGVPLTLPELEAGWGAHQRPEGGWAVTFTFPLRGRRQTAEWEIDLAGGELTARNKLASELGWRESGKKLPQPKPAKAPASRRAAAVKATSVAPSDAAPVADEAPSDAASADVTPAPGEAPAGAAPSADEAPPTGTVPATAAPEDHEAQELPLQARAERPTPDAAPAVAVRKPRKPSARRAAAAATESPVQSVVAVPAAESGHPASTPAPPEDDTPAPPSGSMPPTDLDVVDMVVDLRPLAEETQREPAPIGSPPAPQGGPPAA